MPYDYQRFSSLLLVKELFPLYLPSVFNYGETYQPLSQKMHIDVYVAL